MEPASYSPRLTIARKRDTCASLTGQTFAESLQCREIVVISMKRGRRSFTNQRTNAGLDRLITASFRTSLDDKIKKSATPGDRVMRVNTYVNFPGNCAEAFRYYEQHLSARVDMMMTHAQAPGDEAGPDWRDAVLHGRISIGDIELWAADIPKAEPMRSAYLTLRLDSDLEAERVFSVLSDAGRVLMPIEETFFAFRFGQVQDRFGINWMIIHERPLPLQQ